MINVVISYFKSLLTSKKGQGMAEYALVISFIALVLIAVLRSMGLQLVEVFNQAINGFPTTP